MLISNLPDGVSIVKPGGLNGYSAGMWMRPM